MNRRSLSTQLFLAVLATATVVALGLGLAVHWSFHRGFLGYLNDQAVQRMDLVLPRVAEAYAQHGSWDFLRHRRELWFNLVGIGPGHPTALPGQPAGAMLPARPPGPASGPPGPMPEAIATELLGAARRLTLLDAQRQHVMGFPFILAGTTEREVVVEGRTVGWLALAPIDAVTDTAALKFQDQQLGASAAMVALALGLAALIAWWVARTLLAPVRAVAAATHRLAAGGYDTRVPVQGHDEVAQLAQDFNQLALSLQRNEQARRDYMADISHELRTPLSVLRGELEAMEDGIHPATPEALRALQAEVATLGQLVNDLHELALADVGALSYRKADLDLAALVRQELPTLAPRCAERRLALHTDLPGAPLPVQADPERLRQLLRNLLANSLRYTDAGGALRLALRADGDQAVLDLQDSAPGVPEALLPRLFERFFRAEGSRARAHGGSGLGLAICRSIVQAHGGQITAQASPLGGLWLQVRLPRLRGAGPQASGPWAPGAAPPARPAAAAAGTGATP